MHNATVGSLSLLTSTIQRGAVRRPVLVAAAGLVTALAFGCGGFDLAPDTLPDLTGAWRLDVRSSPNIDSYPHCSVTNMRVTLTQSPGELPLQGYLQGTATGGTLTCDDGASPPPPAVLNDGTVAGQILRDDSRGDVRLFIWLQIEAPDSTSWHITVDATAIGGTTFDSGSGVFNLYGTWAMFLVDVRFARP